MEYGNIENTLKEAEALLNKGEFGNAAKAYSKAICLNLRNNKRSPEALMGRGVSYICLKDYEKALNDFNEAIKLRLELPKEERSKAYNNRAFVRNTLCRHKDAIKDLNEAIRINADFTEAYANRAQSYQQLKKHREAIKDINKAIELDPENPGLLLLRASILLADSYEYSSEENGDKSKRLYKMALRDLDKVLELDGNNATAFNNRGVILNLSGKKELAIKDFKNALRLDEKCAEAYANIGRMLTMHREYQDALYCLEKALDLNSEEAILYSYRGEVLQRLGYKDNALLDYLKVLCLYAEGNETRRDSYAKQIAEKGLIEIGFKDEPEPLETKAAKQEESGSLQTKVSEQKVAAPSETEVAKKDERKALPPASKVYVRPRIIRRKKVTDSKEAETKKF